ncbi:MULTISPECIES: DUF3144 domain-containing protein [Marinobacterium]|uniref:DUF3144 domain-containing protein n=2 Tax=Marinobacterium TaxID=48075 RepID=A0A1H5YRA5_9GAMM|nr:MULTISPECIES: DUF3144 domain-containing protein [Marinobacterium]TCK08347.1 uncharacterized protein DUF3144 [Marinobacterium mangrovicola]SEG26651.1 Protein of unknown function [Marinobacterium lutimaris]
MSAEENLFDDEFVETTNKLIEIANEMAAKQGEHKMGVAFIYAAARYNAYIAASSVTNADELAGKRDKAVEYFSDRFRKLYDGNLMDYIANFEEYMGIAEDQQAETAH